MTTSPLEQYDLLCRHARETSLLASIESLLNWDERTLLPQAAGEYRAEQITYLSKWIHQRQTDPQIGDWLRELEASPLASDAASDTGVTIRQLRRQYDKKTKLPSALVEELTRTSVLGQQIWVEARKNNDFARFRPILEKTFELKRQEADALGWTGCRYDALLDEYEPGESTENVARVLAALREELIPIVGAIRDCDRRPNVSILARKFPIERQREFGQLAAAAIGFDFQCGRLDVTAHPFCSEMGPNDCRITTRYDESYFPSAFFGTLHEAGHGIYDQGLSKEHYGLPLGQFVSMGIHESQSRMWENLVGRSRAFWEFFFPQAQRAFPDALGNVRLDEFHFAVNNVQPSLIRVEADEITYNLHIVIRFELEQALLSGDLSVAELPGAWNAKYREYLGIDPPNAADGVLQDIHWSAGLVGYFPTYTLGNLYAAQFFAKADAELGGLHAQFAKGEFMPLRDWLRAKIHAPGQRFTAAGLLRDVTGQSLGHSELINYLLAKMEPLYSGPPIGAVAETQTGATESTALSGDQMPSTPTEASVTTDNDIAVAVATVDAAVVDAADASAVSSSDAAPAVEAEANESEAASTEDPEGVAYDDVAEAESRGYLPAGAATAELAFDASALQTSPRVQAKQIGMLGNLIGMAVFGFFGLAIGYWLLNFFGGERFNMLKIWLPFIEHTQSSSLFPGSARYE